jgi:hypothetical protein
MGKNRAAPLGHAVYLALAYLETFLNSRLRDNGSDGKDALSAYA